MRNLIKASAVLVGTALFGGCNFAQPEPPCMVGHGGYSAQLIHTGGATSGACFRTADIIGVQKYRQADGSQDIVLKPESISVTSYFDENFDPTGITGDQYSSLARGELTSNTPSAEGFCSVTTLTPATGLTLLGEDLTYTFSNVEFYVKGSVGGTQFRGDLTIDDGAGCTAQYDVQAMFPVVFCNDFREATDTRPEGTGAPSDEVCLEPDHVWSGYSASPLFATKCVPYGNPDHAPAAYDYAIDGATAWHLCVPAAGVPSLLADAE